MNNEQQQPENLLPYDGETIYYGTVFSEDEASQLYHSLMESIPWKNDEVRVFGKHHIMNRKTAWYGDTNYSYTYSNTTKQALPWTSELLSIKSRIEKITGTSFNSCLLNLYHTGNEGMSWHSDDERELGTEPAIASVSLGAGRRFVMKHKVTKEKVSILLQNGSLLLMKGLTQSHWLHSLPKSKKITNMRINLTFRRIITQEFRP